MCDGADMCEPDNAECEYRAYVRAVALLQTMHKMYLPEIPNTEKTAIDDLLPEQD
jgi:hypothetical protein